MRLGYIISHASGQDRSDVHFLVLRFDQRYGFKPGEGESWVMRSSAGKLYNLVGASAERDVQNNIASPEFGKFYNPIQRSIGFVVGPTRK